MAGDRPKYFCVVSMQIGHTNLTTTRIPYIRKTKKVVSTCGGPLTMKYIIEDDFNALAEQRER